VAATVAKRKYIHTMPGTPVVVSSHKWAKLGKGIACTKNQGGFARLIRGSHALEV